MRHLFTLARYVFSALDLHELAHVQQSIAHWAEPHMDLGHYDEEAVSFTTSMAITTLLVTARTVPVPPSRSWV
jgi:hypothetical protein